ncbi:tRNA (guanine46-N7-)-methyltransferase [Leuconostoc gelidum subsp. gasicomitatum]|uniref:tRNA (guanine-N(7)-)-methyltransferase n=1 Tax=Leuconostoc gasicomitatum TaxID=115778 RepID=A0ABM9V195_9LACO|nr:tRNA (guanosine(46)-N7)-methyltransferase TrmB [Leuconostoc gasicomitatum]MBZ5952875.1 tRNA (guanosine(46)-N7)-methyltransferase TrmB [Leuconostoc gasicomitatum]MBZ5970137.1 tRNA (guanosine(46)-N7)-methyltransferase TrmB [Leuconostoc gasicomitatum]MBZ5997510.1 tRNA (guanosine(46)-N7)-methyltransferase TrmB [Leuconostoc gasicomitatum]CUW08117.1 tRNA (guanine46-N7-)-methyltransferase [Leuconostoc gasicomitatum]
MHLRAKPWATAWLTAHSDIVIDQKQATEQIGKWQMLFDQKNPIHIEIGSGKGQFILGMALAHPEINYIGMEIQETAIAIAARKSFEQVGKLPNLRYIYGNGNGVETYFEKAEVAKLYLNFSDPWPKTRHESRRLTYKSFLKSYEAILPEKGEVEFKTDNRHLFEYSMVSFVNYGMRWSTNDYSLDLHQDDEKVLGNIETEYEQKFMAKGQPIYKIKAHF